MIKKMHTLLRVKSPAEIFVNTPAMDVHYPLASGLPLLVGMVHRLWTQSDSRLQLSYLKVLIN